MDRWFEELINFTLKESQGIICVEVDCQKILGVEKAWEYRQRMRNLIPNKIINVFHLEDEKKGLDRLIEFSDYIAISVPELRIHKLKTYKEDVFKLSNYIKNKKPNIDIHLLGCTELEMLKQNNFCTSADSTTYTASKRYGFLKGNHVKNIDTEKVKKLVGENIFNEVKRYNNDRNTATLLLTIYDLLNKYRHYAGNQD
jgi:aspartate/glutamate racemase